MASIPIIAPSPSSRILYRENQLLGARRAASLWLRAPTRRAPHFPMPRATDLAARANSRSACGWPPQQQPRPASRICELPGESRRRPPRHCPSSPMLEEEQRSGNTGGQMRRSRGPSLAPWRSSNPAFPASQAKGSKLHKLGLAKGLVQPTK